MPVTSISVLRGCSRSISSIGRGVSRSSWLRAMSSKTQAPHAVVIGAGLMGVTSAFFLRQKGYDVTVIEKNASAALATSYANAAQVAPYYSIPTNRPAFVPALVKYIMNQIIRIRLSPALVWWGIQFLLKCTEKAEVWGTHHLYDLSTLTQRLTLEIAEKYEFKNFHRTNGNLALFDNVEDFRAGIEATKRMAKVVPLKYKVCSPAECVDLQPCLRNMSTLKGGIYTPDDFSADAHQFTHQLAKVCEELGVKFLYNTNVDSLVFSPAAAERNVTEPSFHFDSAGLKVTGVKTSNGQTVPLDQCLVAVGDISRSFFSSVGVPYARVPVYPMKGHSFTFHYDPKMDATRDLPTFTFSLGMSAITPLANGTLRITTGADFVGHDWSVDPKKVAFLRETLNQLFPHLVLPPTETTGPLQGGAPVPKDSALVWSGLRPMSPDGLPLIGRLPTFSNLFLNCGQGKLGWTLATGSGKFCAAVMSDKLDMASQQLIANAAPSDPKFKSVGATENEVVSKLSRDAFAPQRFFGPVSAAIVALRKALKLKLNIAL